MLSTQGNLCFNCPVPCFFLVSFEDDKRRALGAVATVALTRCVRIVVRLALGDIHRLTWWIGLVSMVSLLFTVMLSLAVTSTLSFVSACVRVGHTILSGVIRILISSRFGTTSLGQIYAGPPVPEPGRF
ncbi:hypothetical protein [Halomontanus rarus]|uniref:hypothetical protein n=1 Tax=Halomontanus rarus TaxID=3034020 RepID=UPI0031F30302